MTISKEYYLPIIIIVYILLLSLCPLLFTYLRSMRFSEIAEMACIGLFSIFLIFFYVAVLTIFKVNLKDEPFLTKISNHSSFNLWQLSHFILYAILASIYPNHVYLIFGLGIVWELIEILLGYFTGTAKLYNILNNILFKNENNKLTYDLSDNHFWYASHYDIIANGAGILFGLYLIRPIYKKSYY